MKSWASASKVLLTRNTLTGAVPIRVRGILVNKINTRYLSKTIIIHNLPPILVIIETFLCKFLTYYLNHFRSSIAIHSNSYSSEIQKHIEIVENFFVFRDYEGKFARWRDCWNKKYQ